MVIVCACEGPLGDPQGETVACLRCHRTYPTKAAVQILKLLKLASREKDNDGSPANEHVRRSALNKAAYKLAALKLRVMKDEDIQRVPVQRPAPAYRPVPYPVPVRYYTPTYATVGTSTTGNMPFGNIFIRVTIT